MNTHYNQLTLSEVGERLRLARDAANVTQAAASAAIDVARTTLVAIEKGQRRIRTEELVELAKFYGSSVNELLRTEAIHVDLVPRFRKLLGDSDEAVRSATRLLSRLAKAEVELESLLGIQRAFNYPPERPVLPGNSVKQADQDALELRHRVGLGLQPITDMTCLLELEFGIRLFVRPLESKISGLFIYDDKIGACMLLNSNHPRERRNQTAAHELGHLVSDRREARILIDESNENSMYERYAQAFGKAFLTPARPVMQRFKEITAGSSRLTRRHIIVLAHAFGVSLEAIVRRIEELDLVKSGTWDWFRENGGITREQVNQVLGDLPPIDAQKQESKLPTTLKLSNLANQVWRLGLLSEGQLCELLDLTRLQLRELLDETETEGSAEYEGPLLDL